jgi:hypothetical protein
MENAMSKNEMLTVPLTKPQRQFVKRVAKAESTSEAAVVRRLIAEAARAVVEEEARQVPASSSRPPPTTFPVHVPVPPTAEGIAAAKARLVRIKTEQRGRWLDHCYFLEREIELAERMAQP